MKEEALKLADDLEELHEQDLIDGVAHLSMPQASAMIRRLVKELDRIKTINKDLGGYIDFTEKQRILAEPVAWMSSVEWRKNQLMSSAQYDSCASKNKVDFDIPLYTAPQTKPLSDAEITELFDKYCENDGGSYFDFAKAIEERHGIK